MTDTDQLKTLISGMRGKSAYSQLESLMPEIDRKIREGVPRAEIHKAITAQGIEISEGTFYNYLYRYRKKKNSGDSKLNTATMQNGNSAPAQGTVPKTEVAQEGKPTEFQTEESRTEPVQESADDLPKDFLSNPDAREKYAEQFVARTQSKLGLRRKR